MISIRKPLWFSEIGKKDNQEDYVFPQNASESTRVFLLCDGMGGHEKGEVASMTAAEALGSFLIRHKNIDSDIFNEGLSKAYDALDRIESNSEKKPGTTMTSVCLNSESVLVAHIGDSRIYQIRPSLYNPETSRGGILYQSSDHSLVNELLKAGELTEEEARNFPNKNIITRAMQPQLERRFKADIYTLENICSGDYFFMCSDGVMEQLTNQKLCEILARTDIDDVQKLSEIKNICFDKTRDNYTCWLIPIDKVDIVPKQNQAHIISAIEVEDESAEKVNNASSPERKEDIKKSVEKSATPKRNAPSNASRKIVLSQLLKIILYFLIAILIVSLLWLFLSDKIL